MKRIMKGFAILGLLWMVGLFIALVYFWPWPGSTEGWLWFLLVAPPVALLLQGLGELYASWWQNTRLARSVTERTQHERFSWLRVAVALVGAGLVTVVIVGIAWLIG